MATTARRRSRAAAKVTFSRFDAADYLKTHDDIVAYLRATLEEHPNDPTELAISLGTVARASGMSEFARRTGLTREALYRALSRTGNPKLDTVMKVMDALGLRLSIVDAA